MNDTTEQWAQLMHRFLPEASRVLKPSGALCCFGGGGGGTNPAFARLALWIDKYMEFHQALVWDKSARGNGMGWRYRRNYEFIMVAHRRGGRLAWNPARPAWPNVLYDMPVRNPTHPNEKPYSLMAKLIENHTERGGIVLDCFAGNGTTLQAARDLGRQYIGCDLDATWVTAARTRLARPYTLPLFAGLTA